MRRRISFTLRLPEPAGAMLADEAEVHVLGRIPDTDGLATLARTSEVLGTQLRDRVTRDVLEAGRGRLLGVCNYAVGYDNIDISAAQEFGIKVTNTPDVLTEATADCAIGLLLAAARRLREGDAEVRLGAWKGWAPDHLLGKHLMGARLGLIGYGRIAQAVAHRASAFGMEVAYVDRAAADPSVSRMTLDELLPWADVISLHVPLTEETRGLLNEARLARTRRGVIIINTSRGAVIDESALASALESGHVAAAGLDVYTNEPHVPPRLVASPHTVLSPHLGSATVETRSKMAELVANNALAILRGMRPPNEVRP